uniref:Uncharacterized protein n=1 Tax=Oryzias latipes TaxID=8090 RepID=A0A286P9S1_ORYLA|nr:hypothetical protein [Oryzias latipes]
MATVSATEAAASTNQTFVVSSSPPWYFDTVDHDEVFTCSHPRGVFDAVVSMMTQKERRLSNEEHLRYRPRVLNKMIRDAVIADSGRIPQRPSRSLLLALMDLVDLLGGSDFGSIVTSDRAGLKQVLLTCGNYTAYYLPAEELRGKDRTVVPVVTQHSTKENLLRYDPARSMVGTYMTDIPGNDGESKGSYFVQEVLFAPTLDSLKLLRKVAGHAFDFWDMSLEMPTHVEALCPSFQQIQPCQLLISNTPGSPGRDQSSQAALASHLEDVEPMCCAPEVSHAWESSSDRKNEGDAGVDCFGEDAVKCDLSRFTYKASEPRMVYFRSGGKASDGRRSNLVPTVAVRAEQRHLPTLYVSTTLRFYRLLKRSCVKGNGELASCWNETLQEMARETYLSGQLTFQEINQWALSAFTKRVDPNGWCDRIPRHVESKLADPRMIEIAELAITFMNAKIPGAFAVAELLHSPLGKLQRYCEFLSRYASDATFRKSERDRFAASVMELIRKECGSLARQLRCYSQNRKDADPETARRAKACAEMVDREPWEVNKIQKDWYTMCKRDQCNKEDKEAQAHAKEVNAAAKVAFLKLKVYCSKLKKLGINAARFDGDMGGRNPACGEPVEPGEGCRQPPNDRSELFNPIPEPVPVSTWMKNLSVLLLSYPWLHDSLGYQREAVCKLLNLDSALLGEANRELLREWVAYNQGTVNELRRRGIKDRLSRALIQCLESQSTQRWSDKVARSFAALQRKAASRRVPRRHLSPPPPVKKPERSCRQTVGRARRRLSPWAESVRASRSPATKRRKVGRRQRNSFLLSEAEEDNGLEPLSSESEEEPEYLSDRDTESSSDCDKSSDDYDRSDSFIDDASSSSEEDIEAGEDNVARAKRREDGVDRPYCVSRPSSPSSAYRQRAGEEAGSKARWNEDGVGRPYCGSQPSSPSCKSDRRGYKRALSSDSSETEGPWAMRVSARPKGRGSKSRPSVEREKRPGLETALTRRQRNDTEDHSKTYSSGRKDVRRPERGLQKSASGKPLRFSGEKGREADGRGSKRSGARIARSRSSSSESRGSASEGSGWESEGADLSDKSTAGLRSRREREARSSLKSTDLGRRCQTVRSRGERRETDGRIVTSPAKPKPITPVKLSCSPGSSEASDPQRKRSAERAGSHAEHPQLTEDPEPTENREPGADLLAGGFGEGPGRLCTDGKDERKASQRRLSQDESDGEGSAPYTVWM